MTNLELQKKAVDVRKGIVTAVHAAKSGHPGGSLSAADIFTYLYFEEMNIDPENPKWEERDRFVLSKGHTAPALYSTLSLRGFFPEEELLTLRKIDSRLQFHDFRIVKGPTHTNILFDILVPYKFPMKDSELIALLDKQVKELNSTFFIVAKVDHMYI